MPTELLVIGAGGHAKVVIEAIQCRYSSARIILVDHDINKKGKNLLANIPIMYLEKWEELPEIYHIAIGDNQLRQQSSIVAKQQAKQYFTVIHPDVYVSPSAVIGRGCFVAAKAIIAAEVRIDEGCIVNHGAIVDHDCSIGPYSHIAPNSTLGAGVGVGQECLIGAGATLLPMIKVGHNVVIGAGAVVTHDVLDNQTVVGVPARCISSDE